MNPGMKSKRGPPPRGPIPKGPPPKGPIPNGPPPRSLPQGGTPGRSPHLSSRIDYPNSATRPRPGSASPHNQGKKVKLYLICYFNEIIPHRNNS